MYAILRYMFGVIEIFHAKKPHRTKHKKRKGVPQCTKKAAHKGTLTGRLPFAVFPSKVGFCGHDACGVHEGTDAHVHDARAPGLYFGKAPRKDAEVDGQDGVASDDHHCTTVRSQEGAHWVIAQLAFYLGLSTARMPISGRPFWPLSLVSF